MLKQFYRFDKAAGIAIHLQPDGQWMIDGCLITLNRQQINFEKKFSGIRSVEAMAQQLAPKTIIALNLSGKGVLTKRIEKLEEITVSNFGKILPNAHLKDFYVQHFTGGSYSFVSIIRKTEADEWFVRLQKAGYYPVILSLGPFAVQNIINELNVYREELIFNGHIINRDGQKEWIDYHYADNAKAEFKIKLQNEGIDEALLLPYACAFQVVLHNQLDLIKTNAEPFDTLFESKASEKKLKVNAAAVLILTFVLLLINFIVFSWLSTGNETLNNQLSRTVKNTTDWQNNTEQIKEKESILQGLGWDGGINKSLLVDDLAAILPRDIIWTEVTINPVDQLESQNTKSLAFLSKRIRVTGYAEKILSVNEWMARIKTRRWAKNVQLENYAYNNEINTGVFTLNIDYQ